MSAPTLPRLPERTPVMDLAVALRAAPKPGFEPTCLYFIQEGGSGYIKIGISRDPDSRLRLLRVDNPHDLTVLGRFRVDEFAEFDAHHALRDLKVRGEWFRPEAALFTHLEALRKFPELAW